MYEEKNLKDVIVALIENKYFPIESSVEKLAQNIAKFEKAYYEEVSSKETKIEK